MNTEHPFRKGGSRMSMKPPMQRCTHLTLLSILTFLLFALSGCVTGTGTGVVSGSLFFTTEPPPPAGEMITVEIYGFATPESPAVFISRAMVPNSGAPSVPFAIAYDKSRITPKDIYIVQAYISDSTGRTIWRTDLWNPIITQGRATDEIQLRLKPN
jgi:hypothetical protein